MKDKLLRSFLVVLLAICVPFQATLAASLGQGAAIEQCHDGHDGHDGHGKKPAPQCGACCASAAITSVVHSVTASPVHDSVQSTPAVLQFGDLPAGLDRPPRVL